ncbi:succinyl-diaminopimelate desuccinylase [Sphingomonas sp. CFBP 13720]|uniref:succinyl-diaminopimelate desuccinylase n=1 Tax=Sphingomonas sp. CFBP 13720 TaxID=2775302 RepID=UPI00177BC9AD|nr:succinyl-diaminopimelate desuccinylase [Sphingomonas sp. CFBP 13720]MBD8679983.1 succinyl-diaminopimelate desuccinylase [Sphingomonas sp. CFBP 13720]
MPDVVDLTQRLIACDSVTPATGGVFALLEAELTAIGFAVDRFVVGEAPDGPVENLLAVRGTGGRHFAFAGHVDVVPAGDGWQAGPFAGVLRGGMLYGRGAVDMKGAVAAFVAAVARVPAGDGTVSLIITGDEEGPAIHGTRALIDRMAERSLRPDLCLVGEPTSTTMLGDMIKIGRRGSVNIWIDVDGRQGHVAYPHLADNPIPKLIAALAAIEDVVLDHGNDWFQPSNIEVTDLTVGNVATNVIPARASARLSIRFNDEQRGPELIDRIAAIVHTHASGARVEGRISGEAFLTPPGNFSTLIGDAIERHTGRRPELSTTGGTSDARFLSALCPTVEFGLLNATMHKVDEAVAVDDLHALTAIYADILKAGLAG